MQQRDFPSLLFFPSGEREFPSPSVFSLHRKGIPFLLLLIITLLFSSQEHWDVLFFLASPFLIRGLRTPLPSYHLFQNWRDSFAGYFLQTFIVQVFCFNISVKKLFAVVVLFCLSFFYPLL